MRALLSCTEKLPNEDIFTVSPADRRSEIASNSETTIVRRIKVRQSDLLAYGLGKMSSRQRRHDRKTPEFSTTAP